MSFQTFSSINYGPRKTSYGRSSGDPPFPLRNVTHFFRLFMLQALGLSVVYKSINVHLGQSQELMSIEIYLKCKYTYENAGFCVLCIHGFKILKIFIKQSKFSTIFHRETS